MTVPARNNVARPPGLNRYRFVCTVLLIMGLSGCASVKWDTHDSGLHGQTFRITEPFVYYSPARWKDRGQYNKVTMKIGRYLMSRKSAGMIRKKPEELESVPGGEVFTIKKSYVTGMGLLEQLFVTPPHRMLIVTSAAGVDATVSAFSLEYTDRDDLYRHLQ